MLRYLLIETTHAKKVLVEIYYFIKPVLPRWFQIYLRRRIVQWKRGVFSNIWPIDKSAAAPPKNWTGWPEGKQFALVLTHDVETTKGVARCRQLIEHEKKLGFRSSLNFVAYDYETALSLRHHVITQKFEIGLHGLNHAINLFKSRKKFQSYALEINRYLKAWGAVGFRSPCMRHNLDWISDLNIEYDSSTFDTDPFEPQPDGLKTIFPLWVQGNHSNRGYVELPYTLPQDFTLFVLMEEKNIEIWKQKLDWIVEHGGMALLNTHPDYMSFDDRVMSFDEYPVAHYVELLKYVTERYGNFCWNPLPREIARFWATNMGKKYVG